MKTSVSVSHDMNIGSTSNSTTSTSIISTGEIKIDTTEGALTVRVYENNFPVKEFHWVAGSWKSYRKIMVEDNNAVTSNTSG